MLKKRKAKQQQRRNFICKIEVKNSHFRACCFSLCFPFPSFPHHLTLLNPLGPKQIGIE
jgi:hypothetical protein